MVTVWEGIPYPLLEGKMMRSCISSAELWTEFFCKQLCSAWCCGLSRHCGDFCTRMAAMAASLALTASLSSRITVTSAASTSFRSGQYAITLPTPSLRAERARRFSALEICALNSNDFRNGTNIVIDGAPWRVQEFLHVKPGKGAAFVRTKLRNYITGNTVEKTFRAGEPAEEASITKEAKQYTYMDADQFVFMDMTSFDETRMSASDLGDKTKWLKENMECQVLCWNDKVIDVELPITVIVKVVQTDPGLKGDTAQGGSKPATTETGAIVSVPLFVNQGDSIQVDTRTSQYMNRVGAF